jgi:aromatic-amino-acid transaminase
MQKFIFPIRNPDIIFYTSNMFKACKSNNKVNLSIGIYADNIGKITTEDNQYLGIKGDQRLVKFTNKLLFNRVSDNVLNQFNTLQTCGGTGALSMVANTLRFFSTKKNNLIIPEPSWPNHYNIFESIAKINKVPYMKYNKINFLNNLTELDNDSHNILLLQTSCHNPTGIDLNMEEWAKVFNVCEDKNITLIMDSAYVGMGNGVHTDIQPVIEAMKRDIDLFVCISYSKIASMYGHRLGLMYFKPKLELPNISDNFEYISRVTQSNPPRMGSDKLLQKYESNPYILFDEIEEMAIRIKNTRRNLQHALNKHREFNFVNGNGLFCLLPFDSYQIEMLQSKYNIFALPNGRINICGITDNNFDYVVKAFEDIAKNYKPIYTI